MSLADNWLPLKAKEPSLARNLVPQRASTPGHSAKWTILLHPPRSISKLEPLHSEVASTTLSHHRIQLPTARQFRLARATDHFEHFNCAWPHLKVRNNYCFSALSRLVCLLLHKPQSLCHRHPTPLSPSNVCHTCATASSYYSLTSVKANFRYMQTKRDSIANGLSSETAQDSCEPLSATCRRARQTSRLSSGPSPTCYTTPKPVSVYIRLLTLRDGPARVLAFRCSPKQWWHRSQ